MARGRTVRGSSIAVDEEQTMKSANPASKERLKVGRTTRSRSLSRTNAKVRTKSVEKVKQASLRVDDRIRRKSKQDPPPQHSLSILEEIASLPPLQSASRTPPYAVYPYVDEGYRVGYSLRQSFLSLFTFHNEVRNRTPSFSLFVNYSLNGMFVALSLSISLLFLSIFSIHDARAHTHTHTYRL